MPQKCTICIHPERQAIDQALVEGQLSLRTIAARWSVSKTALIRHKDKHLPALLLKSKEAEEVTRADSLLEQVRDLQEKALSILARAERTGQLKTALSAIREARGNLELLAKLLGELKDGATVNILVMPEWVELRGRILAALTPHVDARQAVLRALETGEPHAGR